ncbi:hypothetical protein DFP72DRAFT_1058404 [Ephemerocybe angulata]|uniref:Uncharacterized protein n=1 Tax=Ephemerocybe angulata TaxID=980116 RepID=A0A8H6MGL3_9AGAR|nr:hypothetical protein DFP72DRAFT_1058404 [Tulosesus angulatus]
MQVGSVCSSQVFYDEIRPWFRGEDASGSESGVAEGAERGKCWAERSTASSGASLSTTSSSSTQEQPCSPFLKRMQEYMPRLANSPRPLRDYVLANSAASSSSSEERTLDQATPVNDNGG